MRIARGVAEYVCGRVRALIRECSPPWRCVFQVILSPGLPVRLVKPTGPDAEVKHLAAEASDLKHVDLQKAALQAAKGLYTYGGTVAG